MSVHVWLPSHAGFYYSSGHLMVTILDYSSLQISIAYTSRVALVREGPIVQSQE
jgi:hypothetical protein